MNYKIAKLTRDYLKQVDDLKELQAELEQALSECEDRMLAFSCRSVGLAVDATGQNQPDPLARGHRLHSLLDEKAEVSKLYTDITHAIVRRQDTLQKLLDNPLLFNDSMERLFFISFFQGASREELHKDYGYSNPSAHICRILQRLQPY